MKPMKNEEEILHLVQSGLSPDELRAELTRRLVRQAEAEEPEWGALLRAAAIPRRLDAGVVGVLRGAPEDDTGNRAALERLADLPFVLPDPEGESYTLHEETRATLLADWQAPELRPQYVELNRALGTHFRERDPLEALYHRFVVEPAAAFAEFERRFQDADKFYRRAECGALLLAAEEQARELDEGQRLWLRYYRARLALVLDRWAEAEKGYRELLADLPSPQGGEGLGERGVIELRAWTLHDLGMALRRQGKWAEALEMYEQSLRICQELGDRHGEGQTLNNMGLVYESQGRWAEALEMYEQSLRICRELGDRHGEGVTLNNMGQTYTRMGHWAEAKACFDRSLPIRRELGDRLGESYVLHNLGEWYQEQGQLGEAIARYEEALAIRRELEAWPEVGETLHALAEVYTLKGDWAKAAEMARQAAEAWER